MSKYKEMTVQDLIDLLNRRVKFRASQINGIQAQITNPVKLEGAKQELHYLLGRMTAHRQGIRPITGE